MTLLDEALKGKNLVVTGGSNGIGKEIVDQALTHDVKRVLFTYHSGEEVARQIEEESKGRAFGVQLDLGSLGSTLGIGGFLNGDIAGGFYPVDYFIANAAVEHSGDLTKHLQGEIERVMDINLVNPMCMLQRLITHPSRLMSEGGQITVVGSIAADGNHDQFAYSAAKAGLRGAVGSLQYDAKVKEQRLGVKLLEPAFVRGTDMTRRVLPILERRVIPNKGGSALLDEWKSSGLVMDARYAAAEILRLTVDPSVTGVRAIPEGANIREVRGKYFG